MSQVNTLVIVSNRQELVNQIAQKLVLLRSLDKIKSCSVEEAQNMLESFSPNVLILHCENNDVYTLNLIKQIKKQDIYKNLPILLINENCSREAIIEAYDNGISDVLFMPIIDYELLIRVIWCLQKNEQSINIESKLNFMTSLGIIQPETGIYSKKYCEEFLKNEISLTNKYAQQACILLISPDKKCPEQKEINEFVSIIKKSIRLNDSIAFKDNDKLYIYLQKTKLNGAYSVFERINNNLGANSGINAGVVEVQNQEFKDIIEALEAALSKASENTNALIVASDFYSKDQKPILNLEKPKNIFENGIKKQSETNTIKQNAQTIDKDSVKLFNQAYKRKLKVVVNPVFKKYESMLKIKRRDFVVNTYIGSKSSFIASSGAVSAVFNLEYDGLEQVMIRLVITDNDQKRLFETESVDFTILDYRKVSLMLSELIDKFITIIETKN